MRRVLGVAAIMAVCLSARQGEASDLELKPSVAVSEEYNDNVFGTADGRRTDFITRVQPGLKVHYLARNLGLDTVYIFDYRNYAKGTHGDEEIHNADLKGSLQFFENFLFIDFGDALHRTTVNVSRDVATENLLVQQTNQNIAFASPYLLWRLGGKATAKTGYRYTDTRYFEGVGIEKREQVGFADLQHEVSDKLMLSAGYAFTHSDATTTDIDKHDLSGGFRYSFRPGSSLFGSIGNSWNRFSGGIKTSDLFWDAGLTHDLGFAVALVETKVQIVEDPLSASTRQQSYSARLDRVFPRGGASLGFTYLEYYRTQTDKLEQRRGTIVASGRYEIMPKVSFSGSLYGERFRGAGDDYPYRLTANASLAYAFYREENTVSLAYTFTDDRHDLDSSKGEKLTNRVVLQVRVGF